MFIKVECGRSGVDRLSGIKHRKFDHIEFIQTFCSDGNLLVDSHIIPMRYGAVYIFDSEKPHCTKPSDPDSYVRNCVTVDRPYFDGLLRATGADEILRDLCEKGVYYTMPVKSCISKVDVQLKKLQELAKSKAPTANISLCLLELLILLRDNSVAIDEPQADLGHIGRALEFIDRNYTSGIGTKEIAEHLHISKHYLCHIFKHHTGMTLTEYLLEKRLSASNELLSGQNVSIRSIAAQLGFSSESYFIAKYKERYGVTPGKHRG